MTLMSVDEKFHNHSLATNVDTCVLPSRIIGLYTRLAHKEEEEELPLKMVPKQETKTSST